ncbi:hypothetical protein ARHIZOSPH14_08520 [Agromyces rhizosphaerae]|uniref:Uncharacterized protein n=1 Tax=Agromyces rhizosphaerae TaxID=88374 RepID=A0A9W6FNN2_9MICO|nr:hypothetical protein [Agromyces rhizosphaerae]GLI26610.1 hypothetical protein ARHIZOSPH14_08520 [Agromyces rhizosphaerae]
MNSRRSALLALLAAGALALSACASSTSVDGASDEAASESSSEDTGTEDSGEDAGGDSSGGAGSATVTVDGETWEYGSYLCVTGYANTGSDVYSFSSTAFTTVDGEGVQLLVDVRDDSGQDRVSGDGVVYEITVFDTDSPENPSVDVSATGTEGVTITETTVQADGTFTDLGGESHSIQVDATCNG